MSSTDNNETKSFREATKEDAVFCISNPEIMEPAELIPRRWPKLSKDQEVFVKIVEDYNKNPEIIESAVLLPRLYGPWSPMICEDCGRKAAVKKIKELIENEKQ
jgi:hypothetical protein